MYRYLLQKVAEERIESMRSAAASARLARRVRRTRQASPHDARHLLRTIPRQREPEESLARRAA